MSALGNFNASAVTIVKIFAFPLHAAPTADIVAELTAALSAGNTRTGLLDYLFNLRVPQSPFTAYANTSTDTAFCTAMVENFCFATTIPAAVKAGWVNDLVPLMRQFASRGAFVGFVSDLVETYTGPDANAKLLQTALAARAEAAAAFAQSPTGAVYDGQGFGQLLAPLTPVVPATYTVTTSSATVNEGQSLTFTLQTTNVAEGTVLSYTLTGAGITSADLLLSPLASNLTIGANGRATVTLTTVSDQTTEGNETLTLQLAGGLGSGSVVIVDTSLTPPPPPPKPTYVLSATATSANEGASVTFTLTTTGVDAGIVIPFTLSGTGITGGDFASGLLSGSFTINATGVGTASLTLVADALTEGPELLRLSLGEIPGQFELTINDTSLTPAPVFSKDTVIVADLVNNSRATAPPTAAEGEMLYDSYLNVDFLRQTGGAVVRMNLADLRATSPTAGAPLNVVNQSADRGNIPQVSNQGLFVFDLGLDTDRVDFSNEAGKVVALVSGPVVTSTQLVLVNDDAVDNIFNSTTDYLATLRNVEEVVASAGGGVIDLSFSSQDWVLTFSRNFVAGENVDTARDRETHRITLAEAASGNLYARTFFDFRDAGQSASLVQATAAWTTVQGSDRNETLVFSASEVQDTRLNVLRGGDNVVKFNDLTRSILIDVAISPWLPSSSLADDTNPTGLVTTTTTFTTGDGVTLLSPRSTVSTSYTPDNAIRSGNLLIAGSQDAEDAVSFTAISQPLWMTLGRTVNGADTFSVRLAASAFAAPLQMTGFEFLKDNAGTDDVFFIESMARAPTGGPRLSDGAGNDHDAISIGDDAIGSASVGGVATVINLATLNGPLPGFNFDFDILDISRITATGLTLNGTAGTDDELRLGSLASVISTTLFESLLLSDASAVGGTNLTLNLDLGNVAGGGGAFPFSGSVISGGGPVFGGVGQAGQFAPVASGYIIAVVDNSAGAGATLWGGSGQDTLSGGAGDDVLRGGGNNDTLDGGLTRETWTFTLAGIPNANPANRVVLTFTIDGVVLTLSEAAVADINYSDGNGAFVDGSSSQAVIGNAVVSLVTANLAAINAGPGTGTVSGISYNPASGAVLLQFQPGVNANDVVTFNLAPNGDTGSLLLSAGVNVNGSSGGADRFVFEKSGAANGSDTIVNFNAGAEKLDVTAFTGAAITAAAATINAAAGGSLAGVPTRAEFIVNKADTRLLASDFALNVAAGKFVVPDASKCVVAVTADPTGSGGDAANIPIALYFVENGPAAGLSDLTVSLVGTISGPAELSVADLFAALG